MADKSTFKQARAASEIRNDHNLDSKKFNNDEYLAFKQNTSMQNMKKRGQSLSHQQQKQSPMQPKDANNLFIQNKTTYSQFGERNESPTKLEAPTANQHHGADDEATRTRNQKHKAHHQSKSQDNAPNKAKQRSTNYYSVDGAAASQKDSTTTGSANHPALVQNASPNSKRRSPKKQDVLMNSSLNQIYIKEAANGGHFPKAAQKRPVDPS